ncbi:MAG: DUF1489 family protein [Pseudomonadota bacterium]
MPLHIVKLCVGVETLDDIQFWIDRRSAEQKALGGEPWHYHVTRMTPRRQEEVLNGGSLYWVVKGSVQGRQEITGFEPVTGEDGIARCKILMKPELVPTEWQPRRAFQGWRYLKPEDAPRDMDQVSAGALPAHLRAELAELGLL